MEATHKGRGGSGLWAGAIRLMVILGFLSLESTSAEAATQNSLVYYDEGFAENHASGVISWIPGVENELWALANDPSGQPENMIYQQRDQQRDYMPTEVTKRLKPSGTGSRIGGPASLQARLPVGFVLGSAGRGYIEFEPQNFTDGTVEPVCTLQFDYAELIVSGVQNIAPFQKGFSVHYRQKKAETFTAVDVDLLRALYGLLKKYNFPTLKASQWIVQANFSYDEASATNEMPWQIYFRCDPVK